MPTLGIHKDFLADFAKLDPPIQALVQDLFGRFDETFFAGGHLEQIHETRNRRYRSLRIGRGWRGILLAPEDGDTYLLLKVLPHDDAYLWAKRKSISVNQADHRIEIRDDFAASEALPVLEQAAMKSTARLFERISDKDLIRLGIDDSTRRFARALTDVAQLDAARVYLPSTQWEVLYGLAAGYSPDEVWSQLGAETSQEPVDTADLDAAIRRSGSTVALVDGPDELMAIFADPFALWRIYLHPTQRALVEGQYSGPARVTGGPGTGKTVVALHRARVLAERGDGDVLITTFTANLAASLEDQFEVLTDGGRLPSKVVITNIDKLANRIVSGEHGRLTIMSAEDQTALWDRIIHDQSASFGAAFVADEWRHVLLAQRIDDREVYLAAKRGGRGKPLRSAQREAVWRVVQAFERELTQCRCWTHETIAREATRIVTGRADKPYRHVIVDEAQDLSPDQWRLLRAAVNAGPDDIFIAGDTHQRIYDNHVSLREVGVHIAGRSQRLPINYRTTAEILGWSLALLRGEEIDDMLGNLDSIAGCRSDVHGSLPVVRGFPRMAQELDFIAESVRSWLDNGIRPEEIAVTARAKWFGAKIEAKLRAAGVIAHMLGPQVRPDGVTVATMHRMKGLEFRCVLVAGVGAEQVPEVAAVTAAEVDEQRNRQDLRRERCLLFVACTRAREELRVAWHGEPSLFLPQPF